MLICSRLSTASSYTGPHIRRSGSAAASKYGLLLIISALPRARASNGIDGAISASEYIIRINIRVVKRQPLAVYSVGGPRPHMAYFPRRPRVIACHSHAWFAAPFLFSLIFIAYSVFHSIIAYWGRLILQQALYHFHFYMTDFQNIFRHIMICIWAGLYHFSSLSRFSFAAASASFCISYRRPHSSLYRLVKKFACRTSAPPP